MYNRLLAGKKYAGIGLKKFPDLNLVLFGNVDTTFSDVFKYAKVIAASPPIFYRNLAPVSPIFTRV